MKTTLAALLGILFCAVSPNARAQFHFVTNSDNTITITAYTGSGGVVTIPDTINGLTVSAITNQAFAYNLSLTGVVIPGNVTSLADFAFFGCSNLASVTLSNGVASIGQEAFEDCTNLGSVTIPGSVTNISQFAFYGCSNMASLAIASTVNNIGNYAFGNCVSLISITVPGGLGNTGYEFYGCTNLASVTIVNGTTSVTNSEFYGFTNVTSITVPSTVTNIGQYAFGECFALTNVTISNGLTTLGQGTFYECASLGSILLPGSVTDVGQYAFYGCSNLASATLLGVSTSLEDYAFENCTSLASVTVSGGLANAFYEFYGCGNLRDITIADGVTSIASQEFSGFSVITSVTIPGTVSSIGSAAFAYCTNLTRIAIPESVTAIGDYSFYGCSNMTSATISNYAANLGDEVFEYCTRLGSATIPGTVTNVLGEYYGCTNLTNIIIDDGATSVAYAEFNGMTNLATVTVPGSVGTIGQYAFYQCSNLVSATLSAGIASIGDFAFYECTRLASITIPGTVTNLGEYIFYDCANLASATIATGVTRIGTNDFFACSNLATVIIAGSVTNVADEAFVYCGRLTQVYFLGHPPTVGKNEFFGDNKATIYYLPGVSGWKSVFAGLPTKVMAAPRIVIQPVNQSKPLGSVTSFSVTATGVPLSYHWLFNGVPLTNQGNISGATTAKLTVSPVLANDVGSYSVAVSNLISVATSKAAQLVLTQEKTKPLVLIVSPKARSRSTAPVFSGTASDSVRVLDVAYWITNLNQGVVTRGMATLTGGTGFGSSNWTFHATVLPGTNILAVQSSNYSGVASSIATSVFFYQAPATLQLTIYPLGGGTIAGTASVAGDPAPPAHTALYIGEGYTLTAKPAKNWLLVNWMTNGVIASTKTGFTFIMESNLSVTANFATNLFVRLAGRYDGIFLPSTAEAATPANSGLIENLQLETNGVYSAKLYMSGTTNTLTGVFDVSGQSTAIGNVKVRLSIASENGPRRITGFVQGNGWTSTNLNLYAATANSHNFSNYTVLLSLEANATSVAAPGYATIANTGSMINLRGTLPDGASFSRVEPINEQNEFPVYATLSNGTGLLLGTLSLSVAQAAAPTGNLIWFKPAQDTRTITLMPMTK